MRLFLKWMILLLLIIVIAHFFYLNSKTPKESYPADTWLSNEKNKTALIIVAHDDDAISCAGTISQLCDQGWRVKELCFYNSVSDSAENRRNTRRQEDTKKVKAIEGLSSFDYVNVPFRNMQLVSKAAYMPVSPAEFAAQYNTDTLLFLIQQFIAENNPSVIFTLDNMIGGYGHPDHKLISQLVLDECKTLGKDPGFSVKYIYQAVFTPSMVTHILGSMPVYQAAIKIYPNGMPLPDVEVNISHAGSQKKNVMRSYSTEQNSIRKIWPCYQYYPAFIYFRMFDREFFHIVPITESK